MIENIISLLGFSHAIREEINNIYGSQDQGLWQKHGTNRILSQGFKRKDWSTKVISCAVSVFPERKYINVNLRVNECLVG